MAGLSSVTVEQQQGAAFADGTAPADFAGRWTVQRNARCSEPSWFDHRLAVEGFAGAVGGAAAADAKRKPAAADAEREQMR